VGCVIGGLGCGNLAGGCKKLEQMRRGQILGAQAGAMDGGKQAKAQ
jgi:hypothetical protein